MIDASLHPLAGPIDAWEVRKALSSANFVLTLTSEEDEEIHRIAPNARTTPISNGLRFEQMPAYEGRSDRILFLARLHPRKRPLAFVDMAAKLISRGSSSAFILVGPDEGEGAAVARRIAMMDHPGRVTWIGAMDPADTQTMMRGASVYVLPSVGEVFPMTILEAFAAGTPVVTTDSLGIAAKCEEYGAAIITDGSSSALAEAVNRVLTEAGLAESLRLGARNFAEAELSIDLVAEELLRRYQD
jgi:glycosyltransferase involved in cell wall biosynthesis